MRLQCFILRRGLPAIILFFGILAAGATTLEALLGKSDAVVYATAFGWSAVDTETVEVALRVEGKPVRGTVGDAVVLARVRSAHADKIGPFRQVPSGLWFLSRAGEKWTAHAVNPSRFASVSNYVLPVPTREFQRDAVEPSVLAIAERVIAEPPPPQEVWPRRAVVSGLDSPAIRAAFARWRDSKDATVSAFGTAELLERADLATLHRIQLEPARIAGLAGDARTMILSAISQAFRSEEPAGIAVLSALALDTKRSMELREAAAHALAMIHSPHTLRALAALLDDPEMELRRKACVGLGMFANGTPAHQLRYAKTMEHLKPSAHSKYRSPETLNYFGFDRDQEAEFIHFWKDWWQKHQGDFP